MSMAVLNENGVEGCILLASELVLLCTTIPEITVSACW